MSTISGWVLMTNYHLHCLPNARTHHYIPIHTWSTTLPCETPWLVDDIKHLAMIGGSTSMSTKGDCHKGIFPACPSLAKAWVPPAAEPGARSCGAWSTACWLQEAPCSPPRRFWDLAAAPARAEAADHGCWWWNGELIVSPRWWMTVVTDG